MYIKFIHSFNSQNLTHFIPLLYSLLIREMKMFKVAFHHGNVCRKISLYSFGSLSHEVTTIISEGKTFHSPTSFRATAWWRNYYLERRLKHRDAFRLKKNVVLEVLVLRCVHCTDASSIKRQSFILKYNNCRSRSDLLFHFLRRGFFRS